MQRLKGGSRLANGGQGKAQMKMDLRLLAQHRDRVQEVFDGCAMFAAPGQDAHPLAVKPPHFAPKAKHVIFLFMAGAPSQVDLLDPKPKLRQHDGEAIPEELVKGERFAFIKGTPRLLGSPYSFEKVGQAGVEVSELLPELKTIVDKVAVVRSMHTTRGSWRNFQASCPYPTSTAQTRFAPRCSKQSVNPPVDAPTSSVSRSRTSRPK